jgi:hypothetical protein
MVVGVQGAGKSTRTRKWTSEPGDAIYVDSMFATVTRRSRFIEIAKTAGVEVSAVWVKVSLETALCRDKERPADEVVPDDAVENVFRIFEPLSFREGFQEVVVVGGRGRWCGFTRGALQAILKRWSWARCDHQRTYISQ